MGAMAMGNDPLCGLTVGGYRLKKCIGDRSTQGKVFRATEEVTGEPAAVKILEESDWKLRDRFKEEAEIHRNLKHGHIVPIKSSGYDPFRELFFIATKFVDGSSLKTVIKKHNGLSLDEIINILLPITGALNQIHGREILYLDLKPANIMVEKRTKHLWLIDFGLGVWGPGKHSGYGSTFYWAPEQSMRELLTKRTDIYNFGAVLYQLCTGRLPFYHWDPAKLERKIEREALRPPSTIKRGLEPLDGFFQKALAKKPEDRFQTVEEMFNGFMERVPEPLRRSPEKIPRGPQLPPCLYVTAPDGAKIAYTVQGQGKAALIFIPPWVSNQGYLWAHSDFSSFCQKLAPYCNLIFYDKRGCGRSSWAVSDCGFDAQLQDLQVLADHLDLTNFGIFAMSAGGPLAIRFAADNSKRVSKLILYGTYANGRNIISEDAKREQVNLIRKYWGKGPAARYFAEMFVPNGGPSLHKWLADYQGDSTSAEHAAQFTLQVYETDVTEYRERVTCPILILHRTGDKAIPYKMALELKELFPHATLCPLPGSSHIPWLQGMEQVTAKIIEFLQ